MPRQSTITQVRLNNISKCVAITANTFDILVNALKIAGLEAISNIIQSLVKLAQTIKQDKNECADLIEQTHELLKAIIGIYIKSDTGAELPPSTLNQIVKLTETLHKIHTFVEAQQSGSKIKKLFRHGELAALLKDCKGGLQQGFDFFNITTVNIMTDMRAMQDQAQLRHQEMLDMVETLSSSDSASSISDVYSGPYASSNSISMLPAEPKIFHGRNSELADILKLFRRGTPRIAILGAGGMGKTSLARTVVHHEEVTTKYHKSRFFVICDIASSKPELVGLIGAHLGLKPGKDLTQAVLQHFSSGPPSLLILDNLETVWEPMKSRQEIEEFLSLLTDINSLALLITMRGAERPSKVQWTRPFLQPLPPLAQDAARQMFIDIADDKHPLEEVDEILALTDNMPLSISLLANLVDMEGCKEILSRWEVEKTSLISDGSDRRSNLELSISLSLSSPRITSMPQAQDLLALLSMLPDGLSDVELKQTKFPITDILGCKATLLRTALAYTDGHKRLKVLVPIREYMGKLFPPTDQMMQSMFKHFHELLESYSATAGTRLGMGPIDRIASNYANIQNILQNGLRKEYPNTADAAYCVCDFNNVSRRIARGTTFLLDDILNTLSSSGDYQLKAYITIELIRSWQHHPIPHMHLEPLIAEVLNHFESFDDPDLEGVFSVGTTMKEKTQQTSFPSQVSLKSRGLLLPPHRPLHSFTAWPDWPLLGTNQQKSQETM
ncbi:P-loop containing nucleoside triphosphate hydrolase protein [Mycena metata]|uniref:P-loop containing nucleoside triphosphate hydrolase protein n=1 Tax=Mycena metata TaxID=1033252 RepID=A0AAD7ND94_9AGAR|nr:P-loop containing nucleoside triphosphate hydrolase protein [Mycena metata]